MQIHEKNLERISLKDGQGREAGALYYVPCDFGLASRVGELTQLFPGIVDAVRSMRPRSDGSVDAENAEQLHEAEETLCAALDYVCGVMTSQEVFSVHRPFAVVDGDIWATTVVEALTSIMPRLMERMEYVARITGREKRSWRKRK